VLRLLDARPRTATYLAGKVEKSAALLRSLEKKGFVRSEDTAADRDPLRASAARLRVEFVTRTEEKLSKLERELLAYLELHPGEHNLATLEATFPKASAGARALARRQLARLALEAVSTNTTPPRLPHAPNAHQRAAFDAIQSALAVRRFHAFLLEGVTGSGKTESTSTPSKPL
jgi:primosomal protein N' (replication factor Y)